jgi:hypothetical protein
MHDNPDLLARLCLYVVAFWPGFLSLGVLILSAIAGIGLGLLASLIADTLATDAEHKERTARKRQDEITRAALKEQFP